MEAVIRADGGPEIGYGHLVRASAIAEVAIENGVHVTVATTTPDEAQELFPQGTNIYVLPNRYDPDPFCQWLEGEPTDVVFVDAYPVDTDYQQMIRKRTPLVVHLDDDRHAICADIVVNGNLNAAVLDYEFVGERARPFLGPDYTLLRKEVYEKAQKAPPWRDSPERALITLGGSDPANLTPTVIHAFDGFNLTVDAIVGPGFSEKQEQTIRSAADSVATEIRVLRNPDDLIERMYQADFAMCTSSSTIYEFLALGTPIICFPVADNQEPIAEALLERDAATLLKHGDDITGFQHSIEAYLNNKELRKRRQSTGRKLVDGKGTRRVTKRIMNFARR